MLNNKIKLLFIEDDKIDQAAFERFVKKEKLPYNYFLADSVKEAKRSTFDLNLPINNLPFFTCIFIFSF